MGALGRVKGNQKETPYLENVTNFERHTCESRPQNPINWTVPVPAMNRCRYPPCNCLTWFRTSLPDFGDDACGLVFLSRLVPLLGGFKTGNQKGINRFVGPLKKDNHFRKNISLSLFEGAPLLMGFEGRPKRTSNWCYCPLLCSVLLFQETLQQMEVAWG